MDAAQIIGLVVVALLALCLVWVLAASYFGDKVWEEIIRNVRVERENEDLKRQLRQAHHENHMLAEHLGHLILSLMPNTEDNGVPGTESTAASDAYDSAPRD